MAAALHRFASQNPTSNPNPCHGNRAPLSRLRLSPLSRLGALAAGRLDLVRSSLGTCPLSLNLRTSKPFHLSAQHEESKHSDIEPEKDKKELEIEVEEPQEAWKQTLESFKEEGLKLKDISQEAYAVYSKKAIVILQETSVKLKLQAEQTGQDLSILAKEVSEEGKTYLTSAAKNSPDSVKDIVETFSEAYDDLKDASAVRDFYIGIPYGSILAFGGFLSFMLTGSIPAIRFGIILGSALLALSISSLRSWKNGKPSSIYLKGQSAIAAIIFIRYWRLSSQLRSTSSNAITLFSGAIFAFYVYRILIDGCNDDPSLKHGSEEQ